MKIAPLVDIFFKEKPWEDRVKEISGCGFSYIETWQGKDASILKRLAESGKDCGVKLVSIVINFATDSEVAPISAGNRSRFLDQVDRYSDNALSAGCPQGIVTAGQSIPGLDYQQQRTSLVDSLREAGELVSRKGFCLNLEPLNTEVDHPGYFLDSPFEGISIVKEVGLHNVRMLYDFYHMAIMSGNNTSFVCANIGWIGHFHVAGLPGRHEPYPGEIYYPYMLRSALKAGYEGYFGLEYMPLLGSRETLVKTLAHLEGREGED